MALNLTNTNLVATGSIKITVENHCQHLGRSNKQVYPNNPSRARNFAESIDKSLQTIRDVDFLPWQAFQVAQLLEKLQERLDHLSGPSNDHFDLAGLLDEILTITFPAIYREFGLYGTPSTYEVRRTEGRIRSQVLQIQCSANAILEVFEETAPALVLRNFLSEVWRWFWPWTCDRNKIVEAYRQLSDSHKAIQAALFFLGECHYGSRDPGRRISLLQIEICDFFGKTWSLPQDLCSRKEVFMQILAFKFDGGPAQRIVMSQRFNVFHEDSHQPGLELVKNGDWTQTIETSCTLQLSVVVGRQFQQATTVGGIQCPRCKSNKSILHQNGKWADCVQCESSFTITPRPSGLEETVAAMIDGDRCPECGFIGSILHQDGRRTDCARCGSIAPLGLEETVDDFEIRSPLANSAWSHPPTAGEDSEESIFRIFSVFEHAADRPSMEAPTPMGDVPPGQRQRPQLQKQPPVWRGTLCWIGATITGKKEMSAHVVAMTSKVTESHAETWPKQMTLVPLRDPAVPRNELQAWIRRSKPVLCGMTPHNDIPDPKGNENILKTLCGVLTERNIYASAAWILPSGEHKNNVIFFPYKESLVGAFFPLGGVPEPPGQKQVPQQPPSDSLQR